MKVKRKIIRPIRRSSRCVYKHKYSWKVWKWRIMFTVTWSEKAVYSKGAVQHPGNSYWYADNSYTQMAVLKSGGVAYSGTGATLDAAVKDLESKITARHSSTVDAAIEKTLQNFKTASGK